MMTNRIIIVANLALLGLLLTGRLLLRVRPQLGGVIVVIFMMCSVAIWIRNARYPKTADRRLVQLLVIGSLATILVVGGTYYFDRGGWLWFKLTGYNFTPTEDLSKSIQLSLKEVARRHPFLIIGSDDPAKLILPRGDYRIDHTIVIPPGASLIIEPGTRLRFAVGRSLISYSPIIAKGTIEQPIVFTAKNKWRKWGVVAIVNTGASEFDYARFEHGRQARVNNIMFPGCLSIIESEVKISNSQFIQLYGKDGVYVRKGKVFIHDNLFRDTFKDGLDLDGGLGIISLNQFINCGDEAIDLSDNYHVVVVDNTIQDSTGGRVEADYHLNQIKSQNQFGYFQSS